MTLKIFDNPDILIPNHQRGVALGFFDGVHRGHLELLRTLIFECRQTNLLPCVFTFPYHPETVLRPADPFDSYLSDLSSRLEMMADCGIAETHLQSFDAEFALIEPLDFLENILLERLQTKLIVVGQDYRFGRRGAGDINLLQQWAAKQEIKVIVIGQVSMGGERVSSSRIRSLISDGDMIQAASLLGRPYSISGVVISGRQLGRQLGFPTANITVADEIACPALGVYATRTIIDDRTYDSVTNIGRRPTVEKAESQILIETFLYDTELELYGRTIRVDFLQMIRPEAHFDSLQQLKEQVDNDLEVVRDWHQSSELCHQKILVKGIPVYLLQTVRFAQAGLHLVFHSPLEKRRTSCHALMMRILTASCRRYPSRTSLASALDSLYGSSIEANMEKQGDLQAIVLSADGLIRWTDGSSPFQETCSLLFDILFDPLLDQDGYFDEATVETERQNLILELAARENDRSKYAYDRCLKIFCGDQPQGLSAAGDRSELSQITREELKQAYLELLTGTSLEIYLGGQIDPATLEVCISGLNRMPDAIRPIFRPAEYPSPFTPAEPACVTDHKAVEQARIAMVYTGLPPYFSHQAIYATILNSMLGGDVHSLLFDVVREKMGLAYSVFSMNQRGLSAIFVIAGVAVDKIEPALTAIGQQVANMASGDFDQTLFDRARQMIEASILSVNDDLSNMLAQNMISRLYGRILTRDESLALLRSADPAEVVKLAGQLKLVTCYVMTSPDQNPDLSVAGIPAYSLKEST